MVVDELDPRAILAALAVEGVTSITPVSGGWDTALWHVEHAGLVSALRVFRPEQAETCRRELAAMRLAAAGAVPVPTVRAQGLWRDRPALLLAWCDGTQLFKALMTEPRNAHTLGVNFGRTQARIHAIAVPSDAPVLVRDWIDEIGPEHTALHRRLRTLPFRPNALLHGDFHPLNVMVDTDAATTTGVLDWANAGLGDPRFDIARTYSLLRLAKMIPGIVWDDGAPALRAFSSGWQQGYQEIAGPWGDLTLFHAWAAAFMAVDLAPRPGRPNERLASQDLERLRRRARLWERRVTREDVVT